MPERLPVPRRWRAAALAGLFLASALVTLLVLVLYRPARHPVEAAAGGRNPPAGAQELDLPLTLQDFILPREEPAGGGQGLIPFRERFSSWSDEQVRRYWVPLREIARDVLSKRNDEQVEALFSDVP